MEYMCNVAIAALVYALLKALPFLFLLELISHLYLQRVGKDTSHNELSVSWISEATGTYG